MQSLDQIRDISLAVLWANANRFGRSFNGASAHAMMCHLQDKFGLGTGFNFQIYLVRLSDLEEADDKWNVEVPMCRRFDDHIEGLVNIGLLSRTDERCDPISAGYVFPVEERVVDAVDRAERTLQSRGVDLNALEEEAMRLTHRYRRQDYMKRVTRLRAKWDTIQDGRERFQTQFADCMDYLTPMNNPSIIFLLKEAKKAYLNEYRRIPA